ncbi:MAG: DNA topoisomerase 3 [Paludibacteraceae bacterium]|nr:DNA topoisomerase 3 [Paludibacteraceae bacterium]MDD6747422.1 DNA topoisomerase 3 [Paludibacteraceae bacterium]
MIVCVAEKPSVGAYIANVLGAKQRKDGYFEGNGYQVTWTFGHLCALLDPQEYSDQWKAWSLSSLPMIPARFSIKVSGDEGVHKQFNVIKNLIAEADEVINCGDAGQEGELIQRWVYQQAGCKCPVKRLWVNSLTEEAIRDGFQQLKDQTEYQHLYEAGLMRAIGDWLLGMNATRAYTIRYAQGTGRNRQVLSVGRVQTPTLALVVKRQAEIENFKPRTYWELKTTYRDTLFNAQIPVEEDEYAITSAEQGEALVDSIKDLPFVINSVEKKKGLEFAPKLYDLTSLQVDCNKKYAFSAEQTLQLIQSLYEKRVTTYPRVDTTYLSDDIYPKVPGILAGIKDFYPQVTPLLGAKLPKSKKVFDNKKVTDHHAIIPTGQRPDNLTADEKKVYELVALHFIAVFYPECEVSNTTVLAKAGDIDFKVTGREVIKPGWRVVFANLTPTLSQGEGEDSQDSPDSLDSSGTQKSLPAFVKGESGAHIPQLKEKTTTPPKYYTEATLLRAMETAGKTVENDELREAMKENGIGRPSTRAAIIEKLYQRKYIVKQGKSLRATETGINLIHLIISPLLKSAELTGLWEKKLREIERGEYTAQQFLDELKNMTSDVIRDVKTNKAGMLCPVCRQGLIIRGNTRYGCSRWREGCTYAEPF